MFALKWRCAGRIIGTLRKLVEAWQRSGPNLQRMLAEDKALFHRVRAGRTLLVPTDTGKGHLLWLPTPRGVEPLSLKGIALSHFMDLIVNPKCHKLGGPCHRCGKYYIKKTSRQKMYCSRRCGSMTTALDRTRKRRHEEHEKKLRKAQQAAERWTSGPRRRSWKEWVSGQTRITVKWLTRAVNAGSLKAPRGRRSRDLKIT